MQENIPLHLTQREIEIIKMFLHYAIETAPVSGIGAEHGLEIETDDLWDLMEKLDEQAKAAQGE